MVTLSEKTGKCFVYQTNCLMAGCKNSCQNNHTIKKAHPYISTKQLLSPQSRRIITVLPYEIILRLACVQSAKPKADSVDGLIIMIVLDNHDSFVPPVASGDKETIFKTKK